IWMRASGKAAPPGRRAIEQDAEAPAETWEKKGSTILDPDQRGLAAPRLQCTPNAVTGISPRRRIVTYATLMVHLELGESNAGLLQIAGDLAERFQAAVIGIATCQ